MGEETQVARERITENGSPGRAISSRIALHRTLPTSRRWFPAAVLLTGLVLTLLAAYYASRTIQLRTRAQFETAALRTRATIRARLEVYGALLRGTAGFIAVEKEVTKDRFRSYVQRLRMAENYPGVQGIGFAPRVAVTDKEGVAALMNQQGEDHFHIWPENERADYYPILYLEPQNRRNEAAVGFDMFSEATRRDAMERARDTGDAAATA
jgi:CHASE1-domain containing sensor protein